MSYDHYIVAEKMRDLRDHFFTERSMFKIRNRESGDESDDMFEFVGFFGWLDQRLKLVDDFPMDIELHDSDLDRLILRRIQSRSLKIEPDISIFFIEHQRKIANKNYLSYSTSTSIFSGMRALGTTICKVLSGVSLLCILSKYT